MLEPTPKYDVTEAVSRLNDVHLSNLIKDINDKYLYWDKVKYKKYENLSHYQIWNSVKFSRLVNHKSINFGNTLFTYNMTGFIQQSLHHFDMNIGGYMGTLGLIHESDKAKYLVGSIMEEAISSSIMEGATTTRKKAKEMLRKEIKPKNKSDKMIVNNYHSINYIVANKNDELSIEKLLHIHQLMCNDTLDNPYEEGVLRNSNDIYVVNHNTSEVVHTPPKYTQVEAYLESLCQFFNSDDKANFVHPIIKAIVVHFMIGWIHPFADGNGRTARALFYWYMLKKGYWLTEYLSISRIISGSKNQYEKAYLYTEKDELDLNYFITYHLDVMNKAFDALQVYIKQKQKEKKQVANFLKLKNINERQAEMLKMLHDEPDLVFSVKEISNIFGVANYTARTDLNILVEQGYLMAIAVNKVKSSYIKSEQFDKLIAQ